jgi:type VI protein secretion system component VasF
MPAVRATPRDALVIADGFSCREQIRQRSGRQALHLSEVIRNAMRNEGLVPAMTSAPRAIPVEQIAAGLLLAGAVGFYVGMRHGDAIRN